MKNQPSRRWKRIVIPIGIAAALAFLAIVVALPKASHALVEKACFDWSCGIGPCTFDSACSLPDVGFISYQWDWGDGTGTHAFSEITNHSFSPHSTHNVELTIKLFGAAGESVTCAVTTAPPIGPPQIIEGHCE